MSLVFNQDDSEFFVVRGPDAVSGKAVDAWVDSLAEAGVGTLMSCVCAQTTNYASDAWEPRWSRYDPEGPDDQAVLQHLPEGRIDGMRRWLDSAMKLADMGINFHERAFARCKERGIGAWASIRMNDVHDCTMEDSPLLSSFYKKQRAEGKLRVPYGNSWQARSLDWAREEVRDHYMKLVEEVLGFSGIEGLELDWMRFGYHFRTGRELEGGRILTEWIEGVREACDRAAQLHGHAIRLGVRVPSDPETARNLGLDGAAWAQEGLVDLVVPTPFWATCEFNMPIATWRELLRGTGAKLAGGLEVRYQPMAGGPAQLMSPELARGAATNVLSEGADSVYLFNYFLKGHLGQHWTEEGFNETLSAMNDLERLAQLPRTHGVTYRDVRAPGEANDDALPAVGKACAFRLQTGPKPDGRSARLLLQVDDESSDGATEPEVRVNGVLCGEPKAEGEGEWVYPVPDEALEERVHVVEAYADTEMRIVRVELMVD